MSEGQAAGSAQGTPKADEAAGSPAAKVEAPQAAPEGKAAEAAKPEAKPENAKPAPDSKEALAPKAPEKGDQAGKGDEKPGTEKEAAGKPVVPEKYDLKLPEGSLLDAARVEKVAAYAKAQGLSNQQAQAILERENDAVSAHMVSLQEGLKQKADAWVDEVKADKEVGGQAYTESVELAKRAIDRFAPASLKKTLNDTGLGNHPDLVRTFVRIGRAMAEDKMVHPNARETGKRSIESILYGETEGQGS